MEDSLICFKRVFDEGIFSAQHNFLSEFRHSRTPPPPNLYLLISRAVQLYMYVQVHPFQGPKRILFKFKRILYFILRMALFVFSINGLKQNARSLLTSISDKDFYPLSSGTLQIVLHGSSNNRLFQWFWLAVEDFQPIRRWLKKLPWRAKPCERA